MSEPTPVSEPTPCTSEVMEPFELLLGAPLYLPPRLASWEMHFRVAGAEFNLHPLLLAAICDRESGGGSLLNPRGPIGTGDCGHGRGLMMLKDLEHGHWLEANDWRDALTNIRKGAEILAGDVMRFKAIRAPERAAIAAYDCGAATVRKALERDVDVDVYTTGGNYSHDVLSRMKLFQTFGLRAGAACGAAVDEHVRKSQ